MARKLRYNEEEGGMAKAQLQKIETYAAKLNEMIHPEDELEGWVQNKLAVVAAYMGDVKHYLDYELKQAFGEGGGVSMKERHWEVEFTWQGADDEGRKVNVMADSVSEAEKKVKEKFGPYYKGLRIVEVEEDKEMTWEEYAKKPKKYETRPLNLDNYDLDEMTRDQIEHDEQQLRREQGFGEGGTTNSKWIIQRDNGEEFLRYNPNKYDNMGYSLTDDEEDAEVFDSKENADDLLKRLNLQEVLETKLVVVPHAKMAHGGMMAKGGGLFGRKDFKFLYEGKDGKVHGFNYRLIGIKKDGTKNVISEHVTLLGAERKAKTWSEKAGPEYESWQIDAFKFSDGGDIDVDPGEEIDRVYEAVREQSINDYLDRKEGRGGKVFVEITKPTELKTKAVADKVKKYIDMGYRGADILLKMAFVTSDKVQKGLEDQFKVLKNQTFLKNALDFKKFARGGGIGDEVMRHQASNFYEDMQEAKEHLGEEVWNKFTMDEKIAATEYLKAQGHIGYFGEEEDIETLAAMQYRKGGKS